MKKTYRLSVLVFCVLFFAVVVGCVTATAPGLTASGPVLATSGGGSSVDRGTAPKISNLKMPESVGGGLFPFTFDFEDAEGDIDKITLTYAWDGGREGPYSYPATSQRVVGKKSGTAEGKAYMGDSHHGRLNVSIFLTDKQGNASNGLSGWVMRK